MAKKKNPELELEFLQLLELMESGIDNVFLYNPEQPDGIWHQSNPSIIYDRARLEEVIDLMHWETIFFLPDNGRDT
jgi:hypothetical protein